MSGVVKGIKKVFKKVVKVVKKIIKPLAIAAAVYFTAGLALSAFAPTAGFAASMPGFAGGGMLGTGVGAGATAGTGLFSKAAVALGAGGGLAGGALQAGTAASELVGIYGAAGTVNAMGAAGGMYASVTPEIAAGAVSGISAGAGAASAAGFGGVANAALKTGLPQKAASSFAGMSLADKLILTKVGADIGGALFGPSEQEIAEMEAIEKAKFRGAYYGMDADGSSGSMPEGAVTSKPSAFNTSEANQTQQAISALPLSPEQRQLDAGRQKKELFPTQSSVPQNAMVTGPGPMKQQIQVPTNVAAPAPDVRYV